MSFFTEVHKFGNCSITISPGARLHVLNKYVYVDHHPMLGPTFWRGDQPFEPANEAEDDALWKAFDKWLERYRAHERRLQKIGKRPYKTVQHSLN